VHGVGRMLKVLYHAQGMAQVMYARARFPTCRFETRPAEHADEQFFDHDAGVVATLLLMPEETGRMRASARRPSDGHRDRPGAPR
jgi:hypothetical protein